MAGNKYTPGGNNLVLFSAGNLKTMKTAKPVIEK